MADNKISLAKQKKSIVDTFTGAKPETSYTDEPTPGMPSSTLPQSYEIGETGPETAARLDQENVARIQDANLANPAIAGKMAAANDMIKRFNDMQKAKLMQAVAPQPAAPQAPADPMDATPEQQAIKALLMKRLAGGQ